MLSSCVWLWLGELASVAATVNKAVPVADGVPEIAPVEEFSEIPVGRLPVAMLHL
jgi:hypothetical protein